MTADYILNQIVEEFSNNLIPGWCPLEKALDMAATVIAMRPKVVVEIGVYGGKSLIPMALACEAVNCGMVIGIDPWSPQESAKGYGGDNEAWWGKLDHESLYQGFMANVKRLGLGYRVAIARTTSDKAKIPGAINLLHLDGQHTEQACIDVKNFAPHVCLGGIVVVDDLSWANNGVPHVALAVKELLNLGFIELHRTKTTDGEWGTFQRVSFPVPEAPVVAKKKKKKCR
jgi:hypothetical protein